MNFVNAYRDYTSLPQPRFSTVSVNDLIHAVIQLMDPDLKQQGILLTSGVRPADLAITADAEQLQMVLINLVKNARDALAGTSDGRISLQASRNPQQQVVMEVTENGPGIELEALEDRRRVGKGKRGTE